LLVAVSVKHEPVSVYIHKDGASSVSERDGDSAVVKPKPRVVAKGTPAERCPIWCLFADAAFPVDVTVVTVFKVAKPSFSTAPGLRDHNTENESTKERRYY
jgi:hypothetical protein